MAIVRLKDREPLYQPELSDPKFNSYISVKKKVKPDAVDPLKDIKALRYQPPVFYPFYTQNKRLEKVVISEEKEFRKSQYPTMNDRVAIEIEYAKEKMREVKEQELKDRIRRKWERRILKEENLLAKISESNQNSGLVEVIEDDEDDDDDNDIDDAEENGEEKEDGQAAKKNMTDEDEEVFKEQTKILKEKKYCKQRNSRKSHYNWTPYQCWSYSTKLYFGLISTSKELTEVTTWLFIGQVNK
jgi:hypothetical protein